MVLRRITVYKFNLLGAWIALTETAVIDKINTLSYRSGCYIRKKQHAVLKCWGL